MDLNPQKMITRLSYTDFNGKEILEHVSSGNSLNTELLNKFAPNVVEELKSYLIGLKICKDSFDLSHFQ